MDGKILCFPMTGKERKKCCVFAALCQAVVLWQVLVSIGIVLSLFLSIAADFSLNLKKNWGVIFLVWVGIFLLLAVWRYRCLGKNGREPDGGTFVVKCSLMPNYMRFYSDTHPEIHQFVNYGDVYRMASVGRSVFLWIQDEKRSLYQVLPSSAFEGWREFFEVTGYLKARVKEMGEPGKRRSVLGSFFGGALSVWLDYAGAMLKAFAVILAAFLCFMLIGGWAVKMKG